MTIPRWLFFLVAVWVIAFGAFRIVVAIKKMRQPEDAPDRPSFRKRGLYAMAPRTHIAVGTVYLVLGAFLVAMGFGWQPASGCAGEDAAAPTGAHGVTPESGRAGTSDDLSAGEKAPVR